MHENLIYLFLFWTLYGKAFTEKKMAGRYKGGLRIWKLSALHFVCAPRQTHVQLSLMLMGFNTCCKRKISSFILHWIEWVAKVLYWQLWSPLFIQRTVSESKGSVRISSSYNFGVLILLWKELWRRAKSLVALMEYTDFFQYDWMIMIRCLLLCMCV